MPGMVSPSSSDAAERLDNNTVAAQEEGLTEQKAGSAVKQFWLVANIQDCKVVTAQETASATCFLKFHWQDADFLNKFRDEKPNKTDSVEPCEDDLKNGVYGMVKATENYSPINMDFVFLNQISCERLISLGWTKYDKDKGLVSVQIVVKVTVTVPLKLQRYPYDRHVVPFVLATRHSKDAKSIWELCTERPDWAPSQYAEDKRLLLQSQTAPDLEYDHKQCFAYLMDREGKKLEKPILCVLIERPPQSALQRIALPVFIVVSIAFAVSGMADNEYKDEYGATLTSLLTLTAFSYSVQSSLPKLPYLTWADFYFLFGFFVHFIIVFKITVASQVCLDTEDKNRSFTLGDTACQEVNHWTTIVLAIVWVTFHVLMLISIKLPKFIALHVREPFKKLIKEYADNFFSKPVLCTMNENIESLRTEKYSMEKDVFQSGEYRSQVEENNAKKDKEEDEKKDR